MHSEPEKQAGSLTVSELKALIKECLREWEEEKQRATYAGLEDAYKKLWLKQQQIDDIPEPLQCLTEKAEKTTGIKQQLKTSKESPDPHTLC